MKKGEHEENKKYIDKLVKPIWDERLKSSKGNINSQAVNRSSVPKDVYFSIVNAIRTGIYPALLASRLGIKRQNLTRPIRRLKIEGIIIKKGYGVWEINEDKYNEFLQSKDVNKSSVVDMRQPLKKFTSKKEVRGHGFQFTLKIPKLDNWDRRQEFLDKNNIKYKRIGSNWKGQRIFIRGTKVWLTPVSIVVYAPKWKSYFATVSKDAKSHAIYDFLQIIKQVEGLLKVSFQISKKYIFKVSRQHYGLVKNALAVQYNREGKKLYCYTGRGLWLIIDNSYNADELENVDPQDADVDNTLIQTFFNVYKEYPITSEQILNTFKGISEIQKNEANKWNHYATNIESHTNAIIKLEKGIDKLIDIKSNNPPQKQETCPTTAKRLHYKHKSIKSITLCGRYIPHFGKILIIKNKNQVNCKMCIIRLRPQKTHNPF